MQDAALQHRDRLEDHTYTLIGKEPSHKPSSAPSAGALASMSLDSRKRLSLAIIDFLGTSLTDGTLQPEDADSIEIATNCIAECFHVDPSDKAAVQDALGGQNLLSIYGVYEKLKGKGASSSSGSAAEATKPQDAPADKGGPTEESERLKAQGNSAMQKKDYQSAITSYTSALEISPLNPIYLSNRAAAFSATSQHELAKNDAELATATDPKYSKAWSRLGLARFALGDAKGSMEAYKAGIDAEGSGGSESMRKGYETARRKVEEETSRDEGASPDVDGTATARSDPSAAGGAGTGATPDIASLLGSLGGGGAGGGGMPDLSSIMQNPMMRQMAQNVMSNPEMMNNIMNNPQLRNLAGRFGGGGGAGAGAGAEGGSGGGGGMPNLSEMMNDPAIAEM